jgi:hypothetical protein
MKVNSLFKEKQAFLAVIAAVFLAACGNNNTTGEKQKPKYDTPTFGRIVISVDESFKPIIDSQIKLYKASYPETDIVAYYKPEAECLKDLEVDSVRMVIVTRGLSANETEAFADKIRFKPNATDESAVLVNSTTSILKNTSYVVAGVAVGTTRNPNTLLYLNGVLEGTSNTDWTVPAWGTNFYIGNTNAGDNQLGGIIQKVAFFNRALSADEILKTTNQMNE